jgi:hypothetical protein
VRLEQRFDRRLKRGGEVLGRSVLDQAEQQQSNKGA